MASRKRRVSDALEQGYLAKSDGSGEFDAEVTESKTSIGWVRHLKVKRRDGREGIGWDVLQSIKNELLGPDALAIEFYPPAHNVVDETKTCGTCANCQRIFSPSVWTRGNRRHLRRVRFGG